MKNENALPTTPRCSSCPRCERAVVILPSAGGRGTGELTSYIAECKCGLKLDELGATTGKMKTAIADWNRYVKAEKAKKPFHDVRRTR